MSGLALVTLAAVATTADPARAQDRAGGAGPPPAARSAVLITLDTTRADHLGCYGYFRDTSPALDEFAAGSVRFARCLASVAHTTPSHATLLTGVHPHEHGILANFFDAAGEETAQLAFRTSPTLRSLAEVLAGKGVATGGFVSATPVKKETGLAAGFGTFTEPSGAVRRAGAETIADALAFIDAAGDRPFFAWVHLFDAHGPVKPPRAPPQRYVKLFGDQPELREFNAERAIAPEVEDERGRMAGTIEAANLYDGCLRFQDDQLRVLLERLGRSDRAADTAVIVVGDHGHGLGQHGLMSHGWAYEEQLHVPLLVKAPGLAPRVVEDAVSTIDVLPTLLGRVAGFADPGLLAQCQGFDLLGDEIEGRPVFGQTADRKPWYTVVHGRFRLLKSPRRKSLLFDREADPFEQVDVAAEHPEVVRRLSAWIDEEVDRQRKRHALHRAGGGEGAAIDRKLLEELRSLGYGSGAGAGDGDDR